MQRVVLERELAADPSTLRDAMTDVAPFMRAAGFDEVTVEGDRIEITNHVGLLTISLDCRRIDVPGAVLAYEQVEGIFQSMETRYELDGEAGGPCTVTATTTFALDVSFVGPLLDGTVIKRQRKRELSAQFDYLESLAED